MKENRVLQALADRIQAYFKENPEAMEAAALQAQQMQAICNVFLTDRMHAAIDRINLLSGLNNLN